MPISVEYLCLFINEALVQISSLSLLKKEMLLKSFPLLPNSRHHKSSFRIKCDF